MSFKSKRPPVRVYLNQNKYNLLITILKVNQLNNIKKPSEIAKKLVDKLLVFSRPYKDDNGHDMVEVRLFADEVSDLIHQFLLYNTNDSIDISYFDTLLEYRQEYIKNNKK